MTNKPMLSVERELRRAVEQALLAIKRIYQAGYDGIVSAGGSCDQPGVMFKNDPTVRELRAILDKPSYPNRLCHADKYTHPYICGCLKGDEEAQRRFDEHHGKAAQHQGYPVNRLSYSQGDRRYVNGWNDACSHWEDQPAQPKDEVERLRILVDSKEVERQQCIEECSAEIGALRTQLAEQPAPVAPFNPDTVVCRRYTLEQSPRQNFYHYDLEPVYGSVPVTISELITLAESAPVAVVMPERQADPGPAAGLTRKWAEGWNDALDAVARLNGVKP